MKAIFKDFIYTGKVVALALVLGFGVSVVSAQTAWTGPTATPPGGNAPAPINISASHQNKLGSISVNTTTSNPDAYGLDVFGISRFFGNVEVGTGVSPATLKIVDGNQQAGKVLTSDASGLASWQTVSGGGSVSFPSGAWCGASVTGTTGVGLPQLCQGNDPSVSCPSGFARVNHSIDTDGTGGTPHYSWTCIKQ